ncbi:MAG: lysophospholipid acyltransferase family protein [Bdellovibrionales bacterium]|nr:lysophospholipid acyltransferase family protein [Bdellovibrionales bacterium]
MSTSPTNPFVVTTDELPLSPTGKRLVAPVLPALSRATGLATLSEQYEAILKRGDGVDFLDRVLAQLEISFRVGNGGIDRIPKEGPVVVVANHPFGGIEGVLLAALIRGVRPDFKIVANLLLGRIQELRDLFIFVDPFGGASAAKRNIQPLRESIEVVRNGGLVGVFPSGTVSHLHLSKREVTDPVWHPSVVRVIKSAKASVVPIHFHGRNDWFFQLAGLIHPLLRTAMLPRQMINKRGKEIVVDIGKCIPFEKLSGFTSDSDLLSYLRMRTYILKNRSTDELRTRFSASVIRRPLRRREEPIEEPQDPSVLEKEFKALPREQLLDEAKDFVVCYAYAFQIPSILAELGRLREYTFRQAEEGTGKKTDIDRFDQHYVHLFLWNVKKREVVGAYRLGRTDYILQHFGLHGLYTRSLFEFPLHLLEQLGPSLELGRSFVRPEYQKNYWALMSLWKGIGRYVALHPQYRMLFGPVSINSEYDSVSRQLIAAFLRVNNFLPEFARMVRPKNPLRPEAIRGIDKENISIVVKDIDEVSDLIDEIEARGQGVPVLLRQYLKLGGKLLGFSVDPNFGSVLDGLILVDLAETHPKWLGRYLGKEGLQRFREYHGLGSKKSNDAA